ncbi:MAG: hypothetical protein Q8914_04790 [Bacteroidota bacterium]|nr:hypothetical protein [Bacteroidota bacterium]
MKTASSKNEPTILKKKKLTAISGGYAPIFEGPKAETEKDKKSPGVPGPWW